jgi:hypothetical protein
MCLVKGSKGQGTVLRTSLQRDACPIWNSRNGLRRPGRWLGGPMVRMLLLGLQRVRKFLHLDTGAGIMIRSWALP